MGWWWSGLPPVCSQVLGLTLWGLTGGHCPDPAAPSPAQSCSPNPVDEAGETFGASLPATRSPVPYQGFLPAGLTSRWTPDLALAPSEVGLGSPSSPFPGVKWCQPWLLHISHRDSIGPCGLGLGKGGVGVSGMYWGGEPLRREAPRPSYPLPCLGPHCSLKSEHECESVCYGHVCVLWTVCQQASWCCWDADARECMCACMSGVCVSVYSVCVLGPLSQA